MFKILFYSNSTVFLTLGLINNILIEFLSGIFLIILNTFRQYHSLVIQKNIY